MWVAFDTKNRKRITASEAVAEIGESREARHQAYIEKRFVCPACKMEVSLRRSRSGRWYFSHVPTKNACEYYYWSEKEEWAEELHDEFKLWLKERLSAYGIKVEVEKILEFGEYKLIPDLYFEIGDKKIAIEVVVNSPRTKAEFLEKSRRYAEQGIYVLWIFYWKFKRSDGVKLVNLAKAPLREQRINKRMFRKDSLFRTIHAINSGIVMFFDDEPTKSGDPYSIVTVHLLWDESSGSLLGLMPWVLNYTKPLAPFFEFKEHDKVIRWPDGETIYGPFKVALLENAYPHKVVTILGYYFEEAGYGIRLGLSIGKGIAHRFYLRKGKEYEWGVIYHYWNRNGKRWKWLVSVSKSWPKDEILTLQDLYKMFCSVLSKLKREAGKLPIQILKYPTLAWNYKLEVGSFIGVKFSSFWSEDCPKMIFTKKDVEFLKSLGALKFEEPEKGGQWYNSKESQEIRQARLYHRLQHSWK